MSADVYVYVYACMHGWRYRTMDLIIVRVAMHTLNAYVDLAFAFWFDDQANHRVSQRMTHRECQRARQRMSHRESQLECQRASHRESLRVNP